MADIFLSVGENLAFSPFANSRYFGNTGSEVVGLTAAASGATISQNVETVSLAGSSASYTFQQSGNQLLVFSGGTKFATITVQNDADGTALQFADGTASVLVSAAGMTIGGSTPISATAPGTVTIPGLGGPGTPGTGTPLTNDTDTLTANVFDAGLVYNPGGTDRINSLQDEDTLTGTGTNPTLNATLGNANDNGGTTITPELVGVETVNVAFTGSGGLATTTLDLQDATGVKAVNVTRISDTSPNVAIHNLTSVPTDLSLSKTNAPAGTVSFTFTDAAVAGPADSTTLTVSQVEVAGLVVQEKGATVDNGVETIDLRSTGAVNKIGTLTAEDLKTLNISGDKNLTLGSVGTTFREGVPAGTVTSISEATRYGAGLANVAGSLTKIDASALTADLTLHLGAELNSGLDDTSGKQVELEVIGGAGNDTFVLTDGSVVGGAVGNTDKIAGGAGANKVVIVGSATIAAAAAPTVTNVQAVEIRSGHDADGAAEIVAVNANAFDVLATTYIRNEGQNNVGVPSGAFLSRAEGLTVNLTNYTDAQASAITLAHGTTGNSNIANNIVNLAYNTNSAANTAKVTLVDGINNDPVFNAQLNLASAERVTIVDTDTESNTIHLTTAGRTEAGSTLTATDGQVGKYLNFDSFDGVSVAAGGSVGYGYATNGSAGTSTTVAAALPAIAGVSAAVSTSARDNAVGSVFFGAAGAIGDSVTRHTFENVDASTFVGDVTIRLGEVTRADGVTSQNIKTGSGNDTIIFDAFGLTSAGFTSGDTIAAGTGTDTLVLDGNTATIPGTPRVNHQTSEWDNVSGIDVLRYGDNAGVANVGNAAQVANAGGAYYTKIDNDFVSQTDAGNRLTVVNNDGVLNQNTESDLVLDLRGLSQSKWVTFVGANGVGNAGISSNRLVVDDISANQNMILDGGDTDVRASGTAGYVAGNNNVYEVSNTANVSVSDLSQTKNFGLINFTNDAATAQTLTLTLNNTIVEALVDTSNTAANATTQEILAVVATDNGATASSLNIDARAVDGFRALNVTGSNVGNDVLTLNSNVGGTAHFVDLQGGAGDRINWVGTTQTYTIDAVAGTSAFQAGPTGTTHGTANVEIYDLTGLTYTSGTFTGGVGQQTVIAGAGVDTFVFAAGDTGQTQATADVITGFASNSDVIDHGAAISIVVNGVAAAGTAAINANGLATFNAADNTTALRIIAAENGINAGGAAAAGQAVLFQGAGADAANAYLFISDGVDGVGANDVLIQLTNVNTGTVAFDQLIIAGGNVTIG